MITEELNIKLRIINITRRLQCAKFIHQLMIKNQHSELVIVHVGH